MQNIQFTKQEKLYFAFSTSSCAHIIQSASQHVLFKQSWQALP